MSAISSFARRAAPIALALTTAATATQAAEPSAEQMRASLAMTGCLVARFDEVKAKHWDRYVADMKAAIANPFNKAKMTDEVQRQGLLKIGDEILDDLVAAEAPTHGRGLMLDCAQNAVGWPEGKPFTMDDFMNVMVQIDGDMYAETLKDYSMELGRDTLTAVGIDIPAAPSGPHFNP